MHVVWCAQHRYLGFGGGALLLTVGLAYQPDTRLTEWAKQEALKELAAEKQ